MATATPPAAAAHPACWVEIVDSGTTGEFEPAAAPDESWQEHLAVLLATSPPDGAELASHLQSLAPAPVPFRIGPLHAVPPLASMAPPQDGIVCVLVPTESEVCIGVDFDQAEEVLRQALLHAYGHLLLGHVRLGDAYGHWDTAETLDAEQPQRRWDREVREHCAAWLRLPVVRQVESLDDCTPLEKAQLGLWRMIGEMLGESRRLHRLAERCQRATYQRQAAQRLVAMLEDYGGAMLCDGVGLGKTYVATTLMVHYVNTWKDQHAADPETVRTDPFRITVLAPNSVVSTWHREAIPALSAFGVPLATVRVLSHTKLSRMTRSSELLQRSAQDTLSDLEHLLLSDLVVVDEAHNFRSVAARRTRVLRDLLRLQPRREVRRRVVLLTATPVNNSLEDLRQEAGLLFSRPLWLSDARTDDGYRRQAMREVQERCTRARSHRTSQADVAPLVIHGQAEARFSDTIEFRDDLDFGANVQRIGDYLKEQDAKLKTLQDEIRAAARAETSRETSDGPVRIAEELLDCIVVQRSRALCKTIERQQGSAVELLFRVHETDRRL